MQKISAAFDRRMKLKLLDPHFTVCKIPDMRAVDWDAPFCFAAKTDNEYSFVCPTDFAPAHALAREDGWHAMRIEGVLDFSLVGILAQLASLLAERKIPIFAVSTYDTDYILVKKEKLSAALDALQTGGYEVE